MAGKGGAWKVAYADFVTAMMALFMVLWISSQDKEILIATSRYFQSPFNSPMDATTGILPFDNNKPASKSPSSPDDASKGPGKDATNRDIDLQFLNSIAKDFFRMIKMDQDVADKPIDIQVTSDGLRVNLFNRARKPLFKDNTAEFTEWGQFMMQSLAWVIERNKLYVVIDGHTKSGLVLPDDKYTAWELSSDRANAARRALTFYAVDSRQIDRVTGYADTRPMAGEKPESDANQRIALSLSVGRPKLKEDLQKAKAVSDAGPSAGTTAASGAPGAAAKPRVSIGNPSRRTEPAEHDPNAKPPKAKF
ncbi:flagellar motor protein MotB [Nibricoccus sp. IMCC34717]|uniref:flagellar motor protein MotB n=1 Tax=Nibricoccus sp. IMCC34717 TaxID=3034021 RepID=UPI0038505D8D